MTAGHLIDAMRALGGRGLVHGTVGNGSIRCGERILITPSRTSYAAMTTDDLVAVDADGQLPGARRRPSRELALHLAIYAARPDVNAILHTHSPHATAWSFVGSPLTPVVEEVEYYGIGAVRTAAYAPPSSEALARAAVAALGSSRAVLLARHGAVAAGENLDRAVAIAEAVEHQAHVAWLLRLDQQAAVADRRRASRATIVRAPAQLVPTTTARAT